MSENISPPRPAIARHPVHPTITKAQISQLVDEFYQDVRAHQHLGPIFERHIGEDWEPHLSKMKLFWSSVLLRTGDYKGRPMPAHIKLKEVVPDDFNVWLDLFRPVARKTFHPDAAEHVVMAAERIAASLWLGMFGDPLTPPPQFTPGDANHNNKPMN